jgi:hypothetical protein
MRTLQIFVEHKGRRIASGISLLIAPTESNGEFELIKSLKSMVNSGRKYHEDLQQDTDADRDNSRALFNGWPYLQKTSI